MFFNLSPELTTFLLAMLPVTELRLALPWGATAGGLSPESAFFWATAGNLVTAILLIYLLEPVINLLRKKLKFVDRVCEKIFVKTRTRHSQNFNRFGALFLIALVALPLPGSGGYTGALVAYLFGVPRKTAIVLISIGLIVSGLIILGLTTGVLKIAEL